MATVTSRRAPAPKKVLAERDALAKERFELEVKTAADDARKAEIEARLKAIATDTGETFKVQFAEGYVSASGAVPAEFKGDLPVIQTEAWRELKPAGRKQLEKSGLIKIEPQWGRPSSGRVTVKVF
jgi:hypothetical protein